MSETSDIIRRLAGGRPTRFPGLLIYLKLDIKILELFKFSPAG